MEEKNIPTVEELQAQLLAFQTSLQEKEAKLIELQTALDEDKKAAFEKRDAAKAAERDALIKQGKTEEALTQLLNQFEEYKKQYNDTAFKPIKEKAEKYDQYVNQTKQELLDQLPEELKETFKDMDLEKIKSVVRVVKKEENNIEIDKTKNNTPKTSQLKGKKWAEMTTEERNSLTETDPELARQKIKEYTKEKYVKS